jgi:hypothetical protein
MAAAAGVPRREVGCLTTIGVSFQLGMFVLGGRGIEGDEVMFRGGPPVEGLC